MQIENHKEEVPFAHYEQLFRGLDPAEASSRTGAKWDGKEFYVNLLGREFAISHPAYAIRALDEGNLPPLPTQTFLLRYLLESKTASWAGEWKTFEPYTTDRFGIEKDQFNMVHPSGPVMAEALRLNIVPKPDKAVGILEVVIE